MKENTPLSRDNISKLFLKMNHQNHGTQTHELLADGGYSDGPFQKR
jgi:hypothetical protein